MASGKARVGKERRHHTGMDYWLIRPVSNPDNTTQEQPLSLAVKDERSNCRSTRTSQQLWRLTNTTPADTQLQVHAWHL
ncbi:hypothetical protein Taro_038658 [Colocasia esculenta]|uniref:Uncharacterized protein n=1 Tax=Colocasia esculenta TaxID=4460 RepID=A0A843W7A9_COLES|nr:hypothetical protein [Colocasia esculenta]